MKLQGASVESFDTAWNQFVVGKFEKSPEPGWDDIHIFW
jgi:hypothetical protein